MLVEISTYSAVLPELFLALVAMLFLLMGVARGDGGAPQMAWLCAFALILAVVLEAQVPWQKQTLLSGMLVSDGFTAFIKLLLLGGGALSLLLSAPSLKEEGARFEQPLLMLIAVLGMMLMVSADNFMTLYVALELQSLSLYVLAAIRRDATASSEAGLKYFVLGALASGMLLFGCSLIYGFTGTVGFEPLREYLMAYTATPGVVTGLVLVMIGLCFKVSAAPFHMWTPDVYHGAPTPVTAFFAIVPKAAALAVFLRVLSQPFGAMAAEWQQVAVFVAALSMLIGALAGLRQHHLKRLLAYSSIGHVGYAMMALAAGGADGARGLGIYLAIYILMSAGVFAVLLFMRRAGEAAEHIEDLKGLSKTHPWIAFALAALLFSMAGIPPLAGFFGKLFVFYAAVKAGFVGLAVIGVLCSVVAAFYYLRLVKFMYLDEAESPLDREAPMELRAVLAVCTALVLGFVMAPGALVDWASAAAEALML